MIYGCKNLKYYFLSDATHWINLDMMELEKTLNVLSNPNLNVAKNIIIFIGDGMSLSTVTGIII